MAIDPSQVDLSTFGTGITAPDTTSQTVNPIADPNSGSGSIWSGATNFITGLAGLFDNGLAIYTGSQQKLAAIKQINKDTAKTTPVVVAPGAGTNVFDTKTLMLMGGVLLAGVLLLWLAHSQKW